MAGGFFRELKYYTAAETAREIGTSVPEAKRLLGILRKYGVVRTVKALVPDYEELSGQNTKLTEASEIDPDGKYVFAFVGVVMLEKYVFKCYPKYISSTPEPMEQLKKVLKVIRKYNDREQRIYLHNGWEEDRIYNRLAVSLYLLEDYFQYGLYANRQTVAELNGQGEILWDRTISETFPLIQHNSPYYVEFRTQSTVEDENDYFRRLHECVLTLCSAELKEVGMLELLDIAETELTSSGIEDFGEVRFILCRLEREIQMQFAARKQILLKTIYAFIADRNADRQENCFGLYGTNSFQLVWEKVCGENLGNMREKRLWELPCGVSADYASRQNKKLIEIIDRPIWYRQDPPAADGKTDTLRPDILCVYPVEGTDEYCFGIYDAKYYCMDFIQKEEGCKVVGQPGVEDVAKQYLYRMAYDDFIEKQGFRYVQNMFLLPQEKAEPEYGWVEMKMFHEPGGGKAESIAVVKLCADEMYDLYLADRKIYLRFKTFASGK